MVCCVDMIQSTGTDENIEVKYNTINILLPYEIGGTPVYSNYGGGETLRNNHCRWYGYQ